MCFFVTGLKGRLVRGSCSEPGPCTESIDGIFWEEMDE